ncbi:hypothetical protein [Sporomusa sp. KB1]|uniref:hypothetical protein n=1 Tax=Sporomusa sp. KB1 TaxID=943346 RepID=UPI0011ADA2BC|nr:hypothetical protein [Sporomusa sp. KB1]TWH48777.1 hypothetical protein Salpa_4947 [Sporomusa sp. KB1]
MKKWRILFITLLGVFCFCSSAFAASFPQKFDDRPLELIPGKIIGYFLWQDKEGVHLRMTTDGSTHNFSGTISTDGNFEDVFGKYNKDNNDCFQINKKGKEITYKFTTSGDERAIDFHISKGRYVNFRLSMDESDVDPKYIIIGKDGWHPISNEVVLRYKRYSDHEEPNVVILEQDIWWPYRYYHHRYWPDPRFR